jgi:hypothetical protein
MNLHCVPLGGDNLVGLLAQSAANPVADDRQQGVVVDGRGVPDQLQTAVTEL